MRKDEKIHSTIQRYMECYAEMTDCEIKNKYYNQQRSKHMRGAPKEQEPQPTQAPPPPKAEEPKTTTGGGNTAELENEIRQLKSKVAELEEDLKSHDSKTEELHEEIKRQAKIINKEIKNK